MAAATMKAAVLHAVGDVRFEDVPRPVPAAGEVLLRVAACGVCGSDLDRMFVKGTYAFPTICGHEFSAWVAEIPEGTATDLRVGDLVTVPPMLPCFRCDPCHQGEFSLCEDYDYYGSRRDGAYADYVAGPANLLLRVPQQLDPRAAAMVDPAAIALHALWRTKLRTGHRVAVLGGGGPIGLFAVQWARIAGASEILAVDVNDEKCALAASVGATSTATSVERALEVAGRGFDVVVDTTGVPTIEDAGVALTARHGDYVFIGIPNRPVEFGKDNFARFMRLEINLIGAWNSFSAPFPGAEWTTTVEKLASGELQWEFMITHELPIEQVGPFVKQMKERTVVSSKVLFLPRWPAGAGKES